MTAARIVLFVVAAAWSVTATVMLRSTHDQAPAVAPESKASPAAPILPVAAAPSANDERSISPPVQRDTVSNADVHALRGERDALRLEIAALRAMRDTLRTDLRGAGVDLASAPEPRWRVLEQLARVARFDPDGAAMGLVGLPPARLLDELGRPTHALEDDGEKRWTWRRWNIRGECDLRVDIELADGRARRVSFWTP